ncbi:MAG: hypothetical protein FRX49_10345 [Trebouxia sp. A1-2]|nr:MAG: hypothetical protein FRX49_10345 [Trebouxia sp. A1-2]
MSNSVLTIVGKARVVRTEALDYYFIGPCYSVIAPVGSHDDDTLMLLHFCEEHVDVVAAVLLPVLKDGLTLIKEQQSIMDLGLPAYPSNMLCADLCQRGGEVDEQHLPMDMLSDSIGHHGLAHSTGPMKQQHQPPRTPNCKADNQLAGGHIAAFCCIARHFPVSLQGSNEIAGRKPVVATSAEALQTAAG